MSIDVEAGAPQMPLVGRLREFVELNPGDGLPRALWRGGQARRGEWGVNTGWRAYFAIADEQLLALSDGAESSKDDEGNAAVGVPHRLGLYVGGDGLVSPVVARPHRVL